MRTFPPESLGQEDSKGGLPDGWKCSMEVDKPINPEDREQTKPIGGDEIRA